MHFLPVEIEKYAEENSTPESDILGRLNRETYQKVLQPRMLSGHLQGRVLSMFSHMVKPERVLEIGTYTGYSALCLAEGMPTNGRLDTIDKNEELEPIARKYFELSGLGSRIHLHLGDALEIIGQLSGEYDLVFLDADKENYLNYLDLVFSKLKVGGFLLADNVLWSGKVVNENERRNDRDTQVLIEFNARISDDPRFENVLLPIRDGLMVARKISQ